MILKERRRLVLVARETPLTSIHLRNMLTLSDLGAIVAPPVPAFYNRPKSLDDIVGIARKRERRQTARADRVAHEHSGDHVARSCWRQWARPRA